MSGNRILLSVFAILALVAVVFSARTYVAHAVWQQFHADTVAVFLAPDDSALLRDIAGFYFNGGAYNLQKARKYYTRLAEVDPRDPFPRYQLGRIAFVDGNPFHARRVLTGIIEEGSSPRAYYMRGLVNIYTRNFTEAQKDFQAFIENHPNEWAGYADLAWAYSKTGSYDEMRDTASEGLRRFPENMWLHNMAGVAYWNLGNLTQASEHLSKAQELVADMTLEEWGQAYPGNDPSAYEQELAVMRELVAENYAGVRVELGE